MITHALIFFSHLLSIFIDGSSHGGDGHDEILRGGSRKKYERSKMVRVHLHPEGTRTFEESPSLPPCPSKKHKSVSKVNKKASHPAPPSVVGYKKMPLHEWQVMSMTNPYAGD